MLRTVNASPMPASAALRAMMTYWTIRLRREPLKAGASRTRRRRMLGVGSQPVQYLSQRQALTAHGRHKLCRDSRSA
jgi:hypothetical protein